MRSVPQLRRDAAMWLSRQLNTSLAPPDRVSVNVTLRCNLTCTMCTTCYDAPELSTREIKDLIDQTAAWGVQVFNPLGGEPFLRLDMEEILAYAVSKGFYVTVTTNGTLLSKGRARKLAAIPPDRLHLNLSLDGNEQSNDIVRGTGNWARAIAGYQNVRRADADAGNSRRKILANTILHAANAEHFEAVLDEQAALGFDGTRILNLFRQGDDAPPEASNLWFRDRHLPALEALSERLAQRAATETGPHRIQNSPEELRFIPRYYTEALQPLDAPCWAGWKELYINADGAAIMCDGKLDFLAGSFGNVRDQTLQELWRSPALKKRREVVKTCTSPCIQDCYLRRSSDSLPSLAADAARLGTKRWRDRFRRARTRTEHHPAAVLRLELSDVCAPPWAGSHAPLQRWDALTANAPEPATPENWRRLRDAGHLNFGRGFLGFEVIRSVVEDLLAARLRFGTLSLAWRGEPLLHPEVEPILAYLLDRIRDHQLADRLRVETSGAFLTEGIAAMAAHAAPQEWWFDLDRGAGAGVARLATHRGPNTRLLLTQRAVPGLDARAAHAAAQSLVPGLPVVLGRPPAVGDAHWLRRTDHGHYQATAAARDALDAAAAALGQTLAPEDRGDESRPRCCTASATTPTLSWDGKLVLCPTDVQLHNKVGDLCHERLSDVWRSAELSALRRRAASGQGVPDRQLCSDCPSPWSPNHGH